MNNSNRFGNSEKPWVHIAVHKVVRELDAKMYLATQLANAGFNVTIGKSTKVIESTKYLPKGIYCDIRHLITRKKKFQKVKKNGHKIVAFDEEATSVTDWEVFKRDQISEEVADLCSALFAWGPAHKKALIEKLGVRNEQKIFETGHPRFDVLRSPANEIFRNTVEKIRKKYPNYVLVASNTGGWIMKRELEEKWTSYVNRNIIDNTKDNFIKFKEKYQYRIRRHNALVDLIKYISNEFENLTIIVRPHFTESVQDWENCFDSKYNNVKIIHEHSSIPWIQASKVVIHSSCTTGTEAYIADKNVLTYRPFKDDRFDSEIPNNLSIEVNAKEEVGNMIKRSIKNEMIVNSDEIKQKSEFAKKIFSSIDGKTATEKIIKVLSDLAFVDESHRSRYNDMIIRHYKNSIRKVLRKIYYLIFFKDFGDNYISPKKIQNITNSLSVDKKLVIKSIDDEIFMIIKRE